MNLIVYHIYCVGDYLDIVKSQIERVKNSGLYDWCDKIEVTCVDIENQFVGIDGIFDGLEKVNLNKINLNSFEYWPIKKIWDISQEHEGKVFYFHAKGVSNTYKDLTTKEPSQWKIDGINIWRDALEYYLIDNFQQCVSDLDEYDSCGLNCVNGWYWGNFWWANLSYVKNNVDPAHGDRWYFEAWLNYARTYKSKEYFHFIWNPYFTNLPIDAYVDVNFFKNKKVEIIDAKYGTIGIQQDEGYPPNTTEIQVDVTDIVKNNFELNEYKKINIRVDNQNFSDPIHGQKKFLVMNIKLDNQTYRITYNEGFNVDLNFE